MSKDKKSFVLYNDSIGMINLLSDAQAGQLIKHVFLYVNNVQEVPTEFWLQLAFEPIKLQLIRDGIKWVEKREQNKNNARKRWDAIACVRIKSHANDAVNVTVTDNVNANVNVSEIKGASTPPARKDVLKILSPREATKFINHYNAIGWMLGRHKIVDWESAAKKWNVNNYTEEQTTPQGKGKTATLD